MSKPGLITTPGQILKTVAATVLKYVISLPNVDVTEISAAILHQVINGFEKEPLENDDLVRIGKIFAESVRNSLEHIIEPCLG